MSGVSQSEIRHALLERLKKQKPTTRRLKSRRIQTKLFHTREFRKAKMVLFYVSLPEEVETHSMIRRALRMGKRVVVPRVEGRRLIPSEVLHFKKDLARRTFGILEPKEKKMRPVRLRDIDLIVVPGVAFDAKGRRIGRGGGYYDRFLKRFKGRVSLIGLAFRFQKVTKLPTSFRDIPVDAVLTA